MLPTLLFIFGAYALYALIALWYRRRSFRLVRRRGLLSPRGMMLAGGGVVLGSFAWVLGSLGGLDDKPHDLLGILGNSPMENQVVASSLHRVERFPLKNLGQGERPTYPLLHPETPAALLLAEKTASAASPLRKPHVKKKPVQPEKKGAKALTANVAKKEKTTVAKAKGKKKKTTNKSAPATAGETG